MTQNICGPSRFAFSRMIPYLVALALCTQACALGASELPGADQPAALGIALESYAYPYPVHFLPLVNQGQSLQMAYMDVSPTSNPNGRTVMLFHGKNMGGYYWADTIKVLAQNGYRVIVPDQIGWGKSSKPDMRYSFDLLSANTKELLDHLSIAKVSVIGHSTGGMLAVRFTRTFPQIVERLVLEDPIGLEDYRRSIPPQSDETLFEHELNANDPRKIRAFFARYFVNKSLPCIESLADVLIRVSESGEWPRWAKSSALTYQMIYQQPVIYEYDLLKPPTLLIVGEQDRSVVMAQYAPPELRKTMGNFPEMAHAAAKRMANATVIVVPDCGHIPHLEQPKIFREAVLKFLAGS